MLTEKIMPYIRIMRPLNCFMTSFAIYITFLVFSGFSMNIKIPLFASLAGFFAAAGGNTINDYVDYESDKINHPDRPLPAGNMSQHTSLIYAMILFAIAVATSVFIPATAVVILLTNIILLILYELRFKKVGLSGNIIISYLVGSIFLFGGAISDNLYSGIYVFFSPFFINLAREIYKDIEDMEGDKDRKTLPMKIGLRKASHAAFFSVIVGIILSPIPYVYGVFSIYYMVVVAIASAGFLFAGIKGYSSPEKAGKGIKYFMLVALLSYIAGVIF